VGLQVIPKWYAVNVFLSSAEGFNLEGSYLQQQQHPPQSAAAKLSRLDLKSDELLAPNTSHADDKRIAEINLFS